MSNVQDIPMPREQLERLVRQVVREQFLRQLGQPELPLAAAYTPNLVVNVSARHVHVAPEHLRKLFGPAAELTVYRWLYQPGEFAAEQSVTIIGPRRRAIEKVRILGPARAATQVEISLTDAVALGLDAPCRPSGQMDGSPGCILMGPAGVVELSQGVIRAQRHAHMSPLDAQVYGFRDGQAVRLRVDSDCPTTFENVVCRVHERYALEVHLDTDEGNACNVMNATGAELMA